MHRYRVQARSYNGQRTPVGACLQAKHFAVSALTSNYSLNATAIPQRVVPGRCDRADRTIIEHKIGATHKTGAQQSTKYAHCDTNLLKHRAPKYGMNSACDRKDCPYREDWRRENFYHRNNGHRNNGCHTYSYWRNRQRRAVTVPTGNAPTGNIHDETTAPPDADAAARYRRCR